MKIVIGKSLIFALVTVLVTYLCRAILHTEVDLTDVSGLSAFVTVFGTLYGIMAAFVVFEVWNQYNTTSKLVDNEAQGLERLFRLSHYFRDDKFTKLMRTAIENYARKIVEGKFTQLGEGKRVNEEGKLFRKLAEIIRDVRFDDDHDSVVFDHVVGHYGKLSETRTERINQSLTRLPILLKTFLYSSSLFALLTFVIMPFANVYYAALVVGVLGFVLGMVFQLVEDLDNPFLGYWNITVEPFERALKHIEEDY